MMFEKALIMTSPPTKFDPDIVKTAQKRLAGQNHFKENFHPGNIDGVYGLQTAGAAYRAKYLLGFPVSKDNHAYGQIIDDYLTHKKVLPKAYAANRKKREDALHAVVPKKLAAMKLAANFIGTKESPAESNNQMFGEWYGYNGVAWCCIFVTYCEANAFNTDFQRGRFASYVNAVVEEARLGHRHLALTSNPQPGDLVDYNNGEHIEFFERWTSPGTTFSAIGGNTSSHDGSYSNGGEVARNTRYVHGNFPVTHFIRVGV
jgi:hypothetical protein